MEATGTYESYIVIMSDLGRVYFVRPAEPGGCGNPMLRMPPCIARYLIEKCDLK